MDTKNRQSNNFKKRCPLLTARSMDQPTQCIRATTSFSFFLFWGFSKIASESEAERASTVGNALPYATRWRRLFSELPSLAPADLQTAAKSQYIAVLQNSQWNNMNGYTSMWFFKSSRKNLAASHVDLAELHHLGSSLAWNRLQGSSRADSRAKLAHPKMLDPAFRRFRGFGWSSWWGSWGRWGRGSWRSWRFQLRLRLRFFLLFHHLLQSMVAPKRCEYSANGLTAAATVNEAKNSHSAMAVSKLSGKVLSHDFFGG